MPKYSICHITDKTAPEYTFPPAINEAIHHEPTGNVQLDHVEGAFF
jgi:hypothetical protein